MMPAQYKLDANHTRSEARTPSFRSLMMAISCNEFPHDAPVLSIQIKGTGPWPHKAR